MRPLILGTLGLLTLTSANLSHAQPRPGNWQSSQTQGGWDRDAFWRGAPDDPRQRIAFMQTRIDRGISDGSLDRREARRAQQDLNVIKRDARNMGRRYDSRQADRLQARLDDLGQRLRWQRNDRRSAYNEGRSSRWEDDPRFATQYDASRYYRDDTRYSERRLTSQDVVYRGSDGRYYCKRSDGTTGLIIGGIGGAVAGNVIDGGNNRVAGTLIGGALGAILGKTIDQNSDVRCK